jgi:WD40 repeat protein
MCLCMCVCVCICAHMRACVRMCSCLCLCVCVGIHMTYTHIYTCNRKVSSVAFLSEERLVAVGGDDHNKYIHTYIHNTYIHACMHTCIHILDIYIHTCNRKVSSVAFLSEERLVAVGGDDHNTVQIWDWREEAMIFKGSGGVYVCVCVCVCVCVYADLGLAGRSNHIQGVWRCVCMCVCVCVVCRFGFIGRKP